MTSKLTIKVCRALQINCVLCLISMTMCWKHELWVIVLLCVYALWHTQWVIIDHKRAMRKPIVDEDIILTIKWKMENQPSSINN